MQHLRVTADLLAAITADGLMRERPRGPTAGWGRSTANGQLGWICAWVGRRAAAWNARIRRDG